MPPHMNVKKENDELIPSHLLRAFVGHSHISACPLLSRQMIPGFPSPSSCGSHPNFPASGHPCCSFPSLFNFCFTFIEIRRQNYSIQGMGQSVIHTVAYCCFLSVPAAIMPGILLMQGGEETGVSIYA